MPACDCSRRRFLQGAGAAAVGVLGASPATADDDDSAVQLVTRVDDLGAFDSLNRGVQECLEHGIARNCSVLAPTPRVAEAAEMVADMDHVCFGLHTCLTSEWDAIRWGPVAPPQRVPSLLRPDGTLHQYLPELRNVVVSEALFELSAQLDKVRKLGFDIRYADSHMGAIHQVPGLAEPFGDWCRDNGLIDARELQTTGRLELPNYWSRPGHRKDDDYPAVVLRAVQQAAPGRYLVVHHPAFDDAETRSLGHDGYPGESVAVNLNLERQAFTTREIVEYGRSARVELLRYDEAVAAQA